MTVINPDSGVITATAGTVNMTVNGLSAPYTPLAVYVSLSAGAGDPIISLQPVTSSVSATGFEVLFDSPIPNGDYVLAWQFY